MAQHCFKNEYFDSLLQSCIPCHLRCSSKPPFSCQSYCNESTTGQIKVSDGILWIGLGIGVILTFTVFILMVLFKRRHPKQSKEELKNTESAMELNVILKADIETSVNADIIGDSLQSEASLTYSEEECPCGDCGLVKLQTGFDTSFPLPATEEGATVLVTTKTSEYCSYIPDAIMTL
ncbi:tumor necrosis factor receptor superfamily member 17 [Chelonia mydas]|uniref:tumor necrosis factor receptor superfamily member 17 n=1 Tax=Chelonia mydas TaxID=8469 RepID=UPI00042BEFE0|nr:tumor necrosis factor receptor superfamily member 17 [Chelonia mydas]XP_043379175.1 tumor necrosis factor receptor superfamily member 17 [Chelonia mydas]XP_043379176.1 tumor necrosis factor receptor superfamily member 17 [Chelonia mydas]XP_043379177.1 tumor necrosis factor receptor superfamily member 17 [Chelonia mydas]XP_043379178.1 tumor necrosis factor receptor superfamily member 17 [Chelonia mydas]